jgi:hypothetical protein
VNGAGGVRGAGRVEEGLVAGEEGGGEQQLDAVVRIVTEDIQEMPINGYIEESRSRARISANEHEEWCVYKKGHRKSFGEKCNKWKLDGSDRRKRHL